MITRHGFIKSLGASAALALAAVFGHAVRGPDYAIPQSDDGVPRRLDVRTKGTDFMVPIAVFHRGVRQRHVVAYDLDAQWLLRYRTDPNGQVVVTGTDDADYITLKGSIAVRWDMEHLQRFRDRQFRVLYTNTPALRQS